MVVEVPAVTRDRRGHWSGCGSPYPYDRSEGKLAHGFGGQEPLPQPVIVNGVGQRLHDRSRLPEEARGGGIVFPAQGQVGSRLQDLPGDGRTGITLEDAQSGCIMGLTVVDAFLERRTPSRGCLRKAGSGGQPSG